MNQKELDEILELHRKWLNGEPEGVRANLQGANLRKANIDYSCWPIWCGSLDVKVDKRIAVQLAYHFCRLDCDDPEYLAMREAMKDFANQFHRVDECGEIE